MSELSTSTILAIHALQLMMRKGRPASVREIARSSRFPQPHLRRVLAKLRNEGLIRSLPRRGYVLARAPGEIPMSLVIQAMGEARAPTAPCGGDFDACESRASCILVPLCREAKRRFQETARSFTLAELAAAPLDLPNCLHLEVRAGA